MPRDHKDPGTIAAEIKMMRSAHSGAFLVVEGASDARFWRPRRRGDCEIVDGEGKQNVVRGVRRLDAESVGGVLGIVDDDYDSLTGVDVHGQRGEDGRSRPGVPSLPFVRPGQGPRGIR